MTNRRGACPALFTPMQTGDGLLARIVPADRIQPAAFAALCRAARRYGNGTIEVTARGSLQVRGLTVTTAPRFAVEVEALGIATLGIPVIADPLVDDVAIVDSSAIAAQLRVAIADADLTVAPKVSVAVDGGGCLHLDGIAADVRLRAVASNGEARFQVALGGDAATAIPLGSIPINAAVHVVVGALQIIAAHAEARAADVLRTLGIAAFRTIVHVQPDQVSPKPRPPAEVIGLHPLRENLVALGIALAFGHAHADALEELATSASARGAWAVRPAPGRGLLLLGISKSDALALARDAERLGFIMRANDSRRRIVACPGKPACGSGLIPSRVLAGDIASVAELPDSGVAIHVSGCRKGCAHPARAALTIVGTERGCGIIQGGSARATPSARVGPQDLAAEVARLLQSKSELTHA